MFRYCIGMGQGCVCIRACGLKYSKYYELLVCADLTHLPLKALDNFEITSESAQEEPIDLLTLGQLRCLNEGAFVSGEIPGREAKIVSCEPLIDWAVDRCEGMVYVWAITPNMWYRLGTPSPRYVDLYNNVLLGVDIVEMGMKALGKDEDLVIKDLVENLCLNIKSSSVSRRRSSVPFHVKKFALSQLEAYMGKRKVPFNQKKKKGSGLKQADDYFVGLEDISDDDMPEDFDIEEEDVNEDIDEEELYKMRKKAWRKSKLHKKKVEEQRKIAIKEGERRSREAKEAETRGEPPPMSKKFRTPAKYVGRMLYIWGFLQEFGDALQLAPFSLPSLEAAISPGPSVDVILRCEDENDEVGAKETRSSTKHAASGTWDIQRIKDEDEGEYNNSSSANEAENHVQHDALVAASNFSSKGQSNCSEGNAEIETEDTISPSKKMTSDSRYDHVPTSKMTEESKASPGEEVRTSEIVARDNSSNYQAAEHLKEQNVDGTEQNGIQITPIVVPSVPIKRGRGRPRKDGSAPRPSMMRKAPQNIIYEPTIKTRRQKGIDIPLKHHDSDYEDVDFEDDDVDFSIDSSHKKMKRSKVNKPVTKTSWTPRPSCGPNDISAAIAAAQAAQNAYNKMMLQKYNVNSKTAQHLCPVDAAYAPSGVLLRDIVLSLVGAIQGTLKVPKSREEKPMTASVSDKRWGKSPFWDEAAANTIWSSKSASPDVKHAALRLAYSEFVDLGIEERISIIETLIEDALESPWLSSTLTKRIESYQQQISRGTVLDNMMMNEQTRIKQIQSQILQQVEQEAENDSNLSLPLREWLAWGKILGLGLRSHIGSDYYGRRYWVIGQEAGAFRVFCQSLATFDKGESEPDIWGWYEGAQINELVSWLHKANIKEELRLCAALQSAPLPISPSSSAGTSTVLQGEALQLQRSDGYRNINHPLLRGAWNLFKEGFMSSNPTTEEHATQAIEAILGSIAFWFGVCDLIYMCVVTATVLIGGICFVAF